MTFNILIKNIIITLRLIIKNKVFLIYSVLADLLFLFLYGMLTSSFYQEILFNILRISEEAGRYSIIKGDSASNLISSLKNYPEINIYINKILFNIFVIIIIVYFLYSILQGFSWFVANKVVNKKADFLSYFKKFFLINLLWFLLYNIYNFLNIILGFRQNYAQRYGLIVRDYSNIYLVVFLIVILYLAFISYSLISKYKVIPALKKTFIITFKKIRDILVSYFIIFVILFIVNFILKLSFNVNPTLMFILGVIIALPAIYWARVYLCFNIEEI
jgi:hypothetical protein